MRKRLKKIVARRHIQTGMALLLVSFGCATHAASPAPAAAEHGMVVSAHQLATEAGLATLRQGGNAIDAAVAVGYALAVVYPAAGNIGGGGFMTIRLADGSSHFIDFRETAPAKARADMFIDKNGQVIPNLSTRGYLAAGIPGTVAGLEYVRKHYGSKPRAALLAPAIKMASQGYVLQQGDVDLLAEATADFQKDPASAAIFLKNGQPLHVGDRLVQSDLGLTLQAIAKDGPQAFYRGPIAARLIKASQAHGGLFSASDFASYAVHERAPLECDYRGFHILSAPPPSSGGVVICETLNILSGYNMSALGFHSAAGTHLMIEALRRAYHDRNVNLGDPDFVKADISHFISPAYAAQLRAGITDRATPSLSLGGVDNAHEGQHTTHYSIVDAAGNAVSVTYTLNDWFGARVTAAGTGIVLNDEMDDFSARPGVPNMYGLVEGGNNAIAPGKRPLSSMTPTILTKDGKLAMVLGTPGGSRIPTGVLQVLTNVIDYGMDLQEAVDAPRIHQQWLPDETYYEKNGLSPDTLALLAARGHHMVEHDHVNQIAAILLSAPALGAPPVGHNRLYGALDPRLPTGEAAGY